MFRNVYMELQQNDRKLNTGVVHAVRNRVLLTNNFVLPLPMRNCLKVGRFS